MREQSIGFDYSAIDREPCPVEMEQIRREANIEAARGWRKHFTAALISIYESECPAFMALQWMIVTDNPTLEGQPLEQMARKHGRGKQALSKGCRDICEKANLPPSQYMRSIEAVKSYELRQRKKVSELTKNQPDTRDSKRDAA